MEATDNKLSQDSLEGFDLTVSRSPCMAISVNVSEIEGLVEAATVACA